MYKCDDRQERDNFLAWILSCVFALIGLFGISVLPAWSNQNSEDLTSQSLEDLMNVQVSSVSKKEEKLSRTAAAVFVITSEDIHDSGSTPLKRLSIDPVAFYGDYTHQETVEPAAPFFETTPAPPHLFIPSTHE